MDTALNFRIKKLKIQGVWRNKLASKCKKTQHCSFIISTCENFQRWKMLFYRREVWLGNGDTDGRAIYNKYFPLKTFVWWLSALKFLVCLTDVLPHSKTNANCYKWHITALGDGVWRHVTPYSQSNEVGQHNIMMGCIFGSNGPILILFIANCSWNLLDSY